MKFYLRWSFLFLYTLAPLMMGASDITGGGCSGQNPQNQTTYTVGGTITGLSGSVVLQNNGGDNLTINVDGNFTFSTALPDSSNYAVTVLNTSSGQVCSVSKGSGVINGGNVTSVLVTCSANSYSVGGSLSGLNGGTLVLQNNGSDDLSLSVNGGFIFSTEIAEGSPYTVTVLTQPTGQTCIVTNGSGNVSGAVSNVDVSCSTNTTTLSVSVTNLFLATNGNAREITVTNTGGSSALNLSIDYPTWPSGTSASSTCGSTLAASGSCTITITPGATATSDCNSGTGSAPTPGVIRVDADNAFSATETNVSILTYGCIAQEGYLFAIDDTTPTDTSIGGTVVSLADNASSSDWDGGGFVTTNATSLTDGSSNTALIVTAVGPGNYAAAVCSDYEIDSAGNSPCVTGTCYSDWYLPAICQMGASGGAASCAGGIDNIETNLASLYTACVGAECLTINYWSSTETSAFVAWFQSYAGGPSQSGGVKVLALKVRCSRDLSP